MVVRVICTVVVASVLQFAASAQEMPLVYTVENTGADCPPPPLPAVEELRSIASLPDPFSWSESSRGRITDRDDWRCRRAEIAKEIQHYELGEKPAPPEEMDVSYTDGVLTVTVTQGDNVLTMTANVSTPQGDGPFPAVIGVGAPTGSLPADIFTGRDVATVQYDFAQLAPWGFDLPRGQGGFYDLYPDPNVGFFAAWAWGVSRIIDGIERTPELNIDIERLGITGCSFAGKIALFSGAFDERIALTIAQEPGGGGAAAWRVTEALPGNREKISNTNHVWFGTSILDFRYDVDLLPFDHHELVAMIAPRAAFVLGNTHYEWMAEESNHVSSTAAREVWKALGASDRFGFSITDGHDHCAMNPTQRPEVEAFVERFLLGDESVDTDITRSPFTTDLSGWITWETPQLLSGPDID